MRALLDVNVLIALFDPFHVNHDRAHEWVDANSFQGWATTPITQNGFLRIVAQPAYPATISSVEAMRRLKNAVSSPSHVFWADDLSLLDPEIFSQSEILSSAQITDVYLLGLAVKNAGRFVTFDRKVNISAVRHFKPDGYCVI